jgi:hypothetical protein
LWPRSATAATAWVRPRGYQVKRQNADAQFKSGASRFDKGGAISADGSPLQRPQISPAPILIVSARITVLKKNDTIPCARVVRRIAVETVSTSAVCEAQPITKEK